jgi:hypothetical protein
VLTCCSSCQGAAEALASASALALQPTWAFKRRTFLCVLYASSKVDKPKNSLQVVAGFHPRYVSATSRSEARQVFVFSLRSCAFFLGCPNMGRLTCCRQARFQTRSRCARALFWSRRIGCPREARVVLWGRLRNTADILCNCVVKGIDGEEHDNPGPCGVGIYHLEKYPCPFICPFLCNYELTTSTRQ